jgi:hypothetical protein
MGSNAFTIAILSGGDDFFASPESTDAYLAKILWVPFSTVRY